MKKFFAVFILTLSVMLLMYGCSDTKTPLDNIAQSVEGADQQSLEKGGGSNSGNIVVANRASGSISVINTKTDQVTNYQLPASPNTPEPMYVVFVRHGQRVFVGDRANDRVVAFRASDYSVETAIPVGQGVFHMWADPQGKQLWVNNDIDNTTSVIDLNSLQVIATIPTPADLVAMGGKPHDVILGQQGRLAYITVLGLSGPSDYVVQFNTATLQETGRAAVGKDPHLSLAAGNPMLYVPCQNTNAIFVLNRFNMNLVKMLTVPGAHGAGMTTNGKVFYTTNLPGGGTDGLFAIDTKSNEVIGSSDTPFAVPHNIAMTPNSKKLYLTHSGGTSNKVTVYKISEQHPAPVLLKDINVEFNPFGIDYAQ